MPVRECVAIDCAYCFRLDLFAGNAFRCVQLIDLDLVVEVADVTHDGLIFHLRHMVIQDDVFVTRSRNVDITPAEGVFDCGDGKSFHRSLECADRIDFGNDHAGSHTTHCLGTAFAHITVAADDGYFPCNHDVRGALDAVDQRFTAAVEVVKLGLGNRVVYVDRRNAEGLRFRHLVETMHSSGGLFTHALPALHVAVPLLRIFRVHFLEKIFNHLLLVVS